MTTVVGERPGGGRGLDREGITRPVERLNLCILRGDHWAFRRGRVELSWRPDLDSMRTGRDQEDVKRVMERINRNIAEL